MNLNGFSIIFRAPPINRRQISIYHFPGAADQPAANQRAAETIRRCKSEGVFERCSGVYVFPADLAAPFELSAEQYVSIFQNIPGTPEQSDGTTAETR